MAKSESSADEDQFKKMDEDSLVFLDHVKKGKPRNFVLAIKGSNVSSLVIKKKSITDKDRKEARGGGFQPVFGVLTGEGLSITFTVARSDGFDESTAATKTDKLKKFLKEQTGAAYKPEFVLVETPTPIPFDDEDLTHPLVAKFLKLEPALAKYSGSMPQLAGEINLRAHEIRSELLDEKTRDNAGPMIDKLVAFLKQAGQSTTSSPSDVPPSSPPPGTPSDDTGGRVLRLTEGVKKLKPLAERAIGLHPERKAEITNLLTQIVVGIKGNQLESAESSMASLAALLKNLLSQEARSGENPNPQLDAFRQRRQQLEPQLRNGQKQMPEKAEGLEKVWVFADQQATEGKFDSANKALDRLLQALSQIADASEKRPPSFGKWLNATKNARFQLRRLQYALRVTNHPTALQIVNVIDPLVERLASVPDTQSAAATLEEFLRSDATITSAEHPNPFGLEVKIKQPLLDAIESLKLELPS